MTTTILAANWKMHHGPAEARNFLNAFLEAYQPIQGREVWLFPSALSIEAIANQVAARGDVLVGAQNVHWETKGAFTGEVSVSMASDAGARAALVGHSERRHVFGETDEETGRKVEAVANGGMIPVLCVGETLRQRDAGETTAVVRRQLSVLNDVTSNLTRLVIAYEPVWAIGTGKTATPADAAAVHAEIKEWCAASGPSALGPDTKVLYGGSVKPSNATELLGNPEISGVLVGGASLDPVSWREICQARVD